MKPPSAETRNETLRNKAEAKERRQREANAKKAKEAADQLFPGEKWQKVEDGIYLSPDKPIGKKSSYKDEKRDAEILQSFGSTVYLVPDDSRAPGKKYDAIVNGLKMEFKNVGGNANTLITHFLNSRSQAPNVFINLETSDLTRRETMTALYGARNSKTHTDKKGTTIKGYAESNKFAGGRIILKLKGQERLVYLNVDDLKIPGQ
jgi:23S rRNA maturation mini-RNase III